MTKTNYAEIFNNDTLLTLFPTTRTEQFFDALFGDATEGAYDIKLSFKKYLPKRQELLFELELHERPQRCLACNLTYGLPEVFSRHPVIDIKGLVAAIVKRLGPTFTCSGWELQATREVSRKLHAIPLAISISGP